jgi:hypothetical protein
MNIIVKLFQFVWFLNGLWLIPLTNTLTKCVWTLSPLGSSYLPTYLPIYLKKVVSSVAIFTTYLLTTQ